MVACSVAVGCSDLLVDEEVISFTSYRIACYTHWGAGEPNNGLGGGDENAATVNQHPDIYNDGWNDNVTNQLVVGIIELNALPAGAYMVQEGTNTVAIAAGAIKDVQGTAITAYNGTFTIDHTP